MRKRSAYEEPEPQYDDDEELRDYSEGSASMSDSGGDSDDEEEAEYEPDAAQPPRITELTESDEGEYEPEIMQGEDPNPGCSEPGRRLPETTAECNLLKVCSVHKHLLHK